MPVTRNFGRLDTLPLTSRTLMREVALMVRERIVRRTRQGVDVDGAAFKSYSAGYAKAKAKGVGGTSRPNLTLSGAMLNDIAILSVTDDEARIGFTR